ncbi:MAG TPA: YitT family protein, partial [Symbiobacteriaceae bacterium]|nr:YitT family protein [Symbiobacteriaceae bacterium]
MRNALAYVQIALGTLISALAINLFLVPTHLPSGGLGGLMLIFNYLWQIPIGPAYFVANIPAIL